MTEGNNITYTELDFRSRLTNNRSSKIMCWMNEWGRKDLKWIVIWQILIKYLFYFANEWFKDVWCNSLVTKIS